MTTHNDSRIQNKRSHDARTGWQRHRSALGVSLLLTATLAVGAATHGRDAVDPTIQPVAGRSVAFSGNVDRTAVMVGSDGLVRMELVMQAADRPGQAPARLPTDLVVILDRSGSMEGQKIRDAHAAIRQLISQLGPEDRFALVAFSSAAQLAIPLASATPQAVEAWNALVGRIGAGGGTYMGPALEMAFDAIDAARSAGRTPRAMLISDGLAAEPHALLRAQALRAASGEYTLSAVGVGSDFDEELMAGLSDAGTGNYYYLADSRSLADVFIDEFETARETVASGLQVRIEPSPGVSVLDVSGYPLETSGEALTFRPGSLFANQKRHVWVTFRVPTDVEAKRSLGSISLRYSDRGETEQIALDDLPIIASVREEQDFFAQLDVDRWAKSVAVEEYNALQQAVSRFVRSGREDDARAEIGRFKDHNSRLNEVAASPLVAERLRAATELEANVDDAFVGTNQAYKQNRLGKALHADSYDKRREGSRK